MTIPDENRKEKELPEAPPPAYLVGVLEQHSSFAAAREYLEELRELVNTLGLPVCGEMVAPLRKINPKFYVGSGKLEEIRQNAASRGASLLIFDCELGPSQQRNIEKACSMEVYDRQEVILDIFARRAHTKEAVLQVELARNRYYLPRLTGAWSHLSRQRGGALGTRGEGEKQIEYDRRMVKKKIDILEEELERVRSRRATQRKERLRGPVSNCAIIGYTNAGKSTLLNTLTGSDVLVEDKLFATLDPTTRRLVLPDKTEVLLTDTVGFVRKLPHSLVEAFKSTLEEAVLADFILLVLDISSPYVHSHWETTLSVLNELNAADKPMIVAFNKCDLQKDPVVRAQIRAAAPDGIFISCTEKEGLDRLLQAISMHARRQTFIFRLEIPASRPDIIALLHEKGQIRESSWTDDGTFLATAELSRELARKLAEFVRSSTSDTDSLPTED